MNFNYSNDLDTNCKDKLKDLIKLIADPELRKSIDNQVNLLVSEQDRVLGIFVQSIEENYQRRYEKAVREMQFFRKKYEKATEIPKSPSVDSTSSSQDRESTPIYHLPTPPIPSPSPSEIKSRHLSRSSSSSTTSSSTSTTHWTSEATLPPLPRMVAHESENSIQSRKPSSSSSNSTLKSNLHPSILQQRKVDPIAFGGSDALWDIIAKSKPMDSAIEKMIRNFLRKGGSPNTAKQSPTLFPIIYGYGMLHAMVAIKSIASVDLLIQNGANLNAISISQIDHDKVSPAYLAASMGWLPGLQCLIEAGADLNLAKGEGRKNKTALHIAAENCHIQVVEYLLSTTPKKYHTLKDSNGANVLHYAAVSGHAGLMAYLVQTFQIPLESDSRGETALHWASRHGHLEVASLLIERCGCDVNMYIPRKLQTPLDMAKVGNHKRLIEYYRKLGALSTKKMDRRREQIPDHLESALSKNGLFGF